MHYNIHSKLVVYKSGFLTCEAFISLYVVYNISSAYIVVANQVQAMHKVIKAIRDHQQCNDGLLILYAMVLFLLLDKPYTLQ